MASTAGLCVCSEVVEVRNRADPPKPCCLHQRLFCSPPASSLYVYFSSGWQKGSWSGVLIEQFSINLSGSNECPTKTLYLMIWLVGHQEQQARCWCSQHSDFTIFLLPKTQFLIRTSFTCKMLGTENKAVTKLRLPDCGAVESSMFARKGEDRAQERTDPPALRPCGSTGGYRSAQPPSPESPLSAARSKEFRLALAPVVPPSSKISDRLQMP